MTSVRKAGEIVRLVRKQMIVSAVMNTVLSAAIFIALFGFTDGLLAVGAANYLARDFLPQCTMVGLMSALVPSLVSRREAAGLVGTSVRPAGRIIATAAGWALASLALGAGLAAALLSSPIKAVDAWQALIFKAMFGGVLGAIVTALALRPMVAIQRNPQ